MHHPIKLQYLYFELILGDFAPALLEVSFGTIFRNPLETNHLKKCLEKHFCAGTLLNTDETLSLLKFSELFCHFSFTFFHKNLKSFVIHNIKGHNISFLDLPLSSPSIYNVIQFMCCKFCSTHFFLCKSLLFILCYITLYLHNCEAARNWRNKKNKYTYIYSSTWVSAICQTAWKTAKQ